MPSGRTDNTNGGFNDIRGMYGDDTESGLAGNDWLDLHTTWSRDHLYGAPATTSSTEAPARRSTSLDGEDGTDRCRNGRIMRNCEVII